MWRPLLQFALLGTALFAVDRLWWDPERPEPVRISAEQWTATRGELARSLGREPAPADLERALAELLDEELLFREALERAYFRDDPVVFRRLVQNLRFAGAAPEREDAELFREAVDLGLHETDTVVRRRLVQRLRLELEATALEEPPSEADLRAHYESQRDRHRLPARIRITQVYFEADGAHRARRELQRLRAATPEALAEHGDPFLHPPEQAAQTRDELAGRFGASFAAAVASLEPGRWEGPLESAFGLHLVRVEERRAERNLDFEEVREAVTYDVQAIRRREAVERGLAELGREGSVVVMAPDGSWVEDPDGSLLEQLGS